MTTLQEQIEVVATLRQEVATLAAEKKARYEKWAEGEKALIDCLAAQGVSLNEAETVLRDLTLADYRATGNKAPAPGVGIRVGSRLLYDVGQAFTWAKQHDLALKLDVPAFEKIAKANLLDFVALEQQITATIATDLDAVLKEQEVKP